MSERVSSLARCRRYVRSLTAFYAGGKKKVRERAGDARDEKTMDSSYLHPADRQDAEQCGQRQHPLHPLLPLPTYDPTILAERVSASRIPREFLAAGSFASPSLPPLFPQTRSARRCVVNSSSRPSETGRPDPRSLPVVYAVTMCGHARDTPVVIPPRAQRTTAARRRWVGRSLARSP